MHEALKQNKQKHLPFKRVVPYAVYALFTMLGLIKHHSAFAQWVPIAPQTSNNLYKLTVTQNHAFIIGAKGTFLYSDDSGSTWTPKPLNGLENLRGMQFDTSGRGAICGENSVIYTTQNRGESWSLKYSNTLYYLNAIAFKEQEMMAVGRKGIALYSNDNGNAWDPVFTRTDRQFYDCIAHPNGSFIAGSDSGYLHFFYTQMGADSQSLVKLNTDLIVRTLQVLPDGTLIASGGNPDTLGLNNHENFVAWSQDSGQTWSIKHFQNRRQFNHSFFLDIDSGYMALPSGLIAHTFDRGNHFNLHYIGTPINLTNLYFYNKDQGIAIGDVGRIYKTNNGGGFGLGSPNLGQYKPFRVGPNPTDGLINFFSDEAGTVHIYSFTGQKVETLQVQAQKDITLHLKPGNYVLYFVNHFNTRSESVKLVVKKP